MKGIKEFLRRAFSPSVYDTLKDWWHFGRRIANRVSIRTRYPDVVVLDVRNVEAGQLNQPIVLDYLLGSRSEGFFLDIGANHPELNSNSLFFERRRQYSGWAFDPLDRYSLLWAERRPRTKLHCVAVGAEPGTCRFFEAENLDGWGDQLSTTELSGGRAAASAVKMRQVEVVALSAMPGLPKYIDFASIDVEGAEASVIHGMGSQCRPLVLLVENCRGISGSDELRKLVQRAGYKLIGRISYIDDVYVRLDMVDALPRLDALMADRADLFG